MVEKSGIESCFLQQLHWIRNSNLREKVIKVWLTAADVAGWKSIEDVPFTLLVENSGKLTEHTKRVTNIAKAIYDQRTEELDLDYLIAGALLHDVGKLLEYEEKNGKYVKGEYGKRFRHPISGALLANELGLPDEVVLIIYAHSHEGDNLKRTPEAVIVNHSDFIDFEIKKSLV